MLVYDFDILLYDFHHDSDEPVLFATIVHIVHQSYLYLTMKSSVIPHETDFAIRFYGTQDTWLPTPLQLSVQSIWFNNITYLLDRFLIVFCTSLSVSNV